MGIDQIQSLQQEENGAVEDVKGFAHVPRKLRSGPDWH